MHIRIHYLQHVPIEGIANIGTWAEARGHVVSGSFLYENQPFPEMADFDWLVVMGGPMGVYDESAYLWLADEKRFLEKAIKNGKVVLGFCLGAQLIANVLGARVSVNKYKEIGWFPVSLTEEAEQSRVFGSIDKEFTCFHWHADTFDIPSGAVRIAQSEGCLNQAFEYEGRIFGIQFHLEVAGEHIEKWIKNEGALGKGRYIQSPDEMLSNASSAEKDYSLLCGLLDTIGSVN